MSGLIRKYIATRLAAPRAAPAKAAIATGESRQPPGVGVLLSSAGADFAGKLGPDLSDAGAGEGAGAFGAGSFSGAFDAMGAAPRAGGREAGAEFPSVNIGSDSPRAFAGGREAPP
ncbi:MAG: hypothetical protein ACHQ49_12345 [Elusimicrobiota bacterium]